MPQVRKSMCVFMAVVMTLVALAGCAPTQPTAPTPAPTTPAPKPTAVPPTVPPTEPPAQPIIIGAWDESPNLNPYYQTGPEPSTWMVVEGLLSIAPDGYYFPQLVEEVPTQENGGLSADRTVITYKLRDGLKWSDGEPVTSADIRFTWEAIVNPANTVVKTLGHENIVSVETPDEQTAVVTLKEPFVPYLTLFPALLPEHVLGDLDSMDNADYNRQPTGTGPYKVTRWVAGSHVEYERNPYYREAGKPLTDKVILKWVGSREAGLAQLQIGEIHFLVDLTEAEIATLETAPDIQTIALESLSSERLFLNLSDDGDETTPHPILSDLNVRQALDYAIDREALIQGLLDGRATPASCDLPAGPFGDPTIPPTPYDPGKARDLLDLSGWELGSDGIRSKAGQRLTLRIATTAGNKIRELTEQLMQEQFADVGIELIIDNRQSTGFWGSWSEGGIRFQGDFDILLYTTGPSVTGAFIDPQAHMFAYYHSSSIPIDATDHKGGNYMRYANAVVDEALEEAASVASLNARRAAYSRAMQEIHKDKPVLFLYNRPQIHAVRNELTGWTENQWLSQIPNWDIANWVIQ